MANEKASAKVLSVSAGRSAASEGNLKRDILTAGCAKSRCRGQLIRSTHIAAANIVQAFRECEMLQLTHIRPANFRYYCDVCTEVYDLH